MEEGDNITLSKKNIFKWNEIKYSLNSFVWESSFIAKRIINLIYDYDFYAVSASFDEKILLKKIIIKHFFILKNKDNYDYKSIDRSIEIQKSLLLFKAIYNLNTDQSLNKIKKNLYRSVNKNGMHNSMNPSMQAEYINNLVEIKNICLFFKINLPLEINFQINNMISTLKSLLHNDGSISLFNGSNNANIKSIKKIINLKKNIKSKKLHRINNGLVIFKNKNLKIFLDVVKPTNKLINKNLHSGTLSFELSYKKEKIITNCGSIEKRIGRKPEFLRYSAAHSTIVLNNTNISELVAKKSYSRVPKNVVFESDENSDELIWITMHDGYQDNFKKIVKRKIFISKKTFNIRAEDSIINSKSFKDDIIYSIRFHLTPICTCLLTQNKKSVLIKTNLDQSFVFKSESKLTLDDSIYISDGKKIEKTKQIVITGRCKTPKTIIKWFITKLN